jgi:phosphoglycolate phosphatase
MAREKGKRKNKESEAGFIMIKGVVFDFDGVIADSLDFVLDKINRYMEGWGKDRMTRGFFRSHDVEEVFREQGVNRLLELFMLWRVRSEIHKNLSSIPVHPHIIPAAKNISERVPLSILTSNSRGNVMDFLRTHHIHNYFLEIHGNYLMFDKAKGLSGILQREGLEANNVAYVGDEPRDIRTARAVGAHSIAVDWGYAERGLLESHRPEAIASTPEELFKAIVSF